MANRKPTKLLEISGAFKHNPARRREPAPTDGRPLGDPPERLPVEARTYWREIVDQVPEGVLTMADRWCVELAARLMHKAASAPNAAAILELARSSELSTADVKAMVARETITSAELATLKGLLASMGMDPSSRSKLSIAAAKPENKFAALRERSDRNRQPK